MLTVYRVLHEEGGSVMTRTVSGRDATHQVRLSWSWETQVEYSYFQNKWPGATCALHILHEIFEKSSILRVPPEPSDAFM